MADPVIHISEEDAARDFAGLMARVRAGAEVVIESDARAVAVVPDHLDKIAPTSPEDKEVADMRILLQLLLHQNSQ